MGLGFMKSVPAPIAVDFGVARLKVLQVQPGAAGELPTLVGLAWRDVPAELSERPAERLGWQAEALAEMLRGGSFKGKRAVCAISSVHAIAQHVQVTRDGNKPIDGAVAEELRTMTGREPSTLITRHMEVAEVSRGGAKRSEVICFAIPRDAVIAHMRALKACKLEAVGVHAEHLALVRSMDRLHAAGKDATGSATLIVDLGYAATKVTVSHGRDLVLAKTIAVGGKQIGSAQPAAASAGAGGGVAVAEPAAKPTTNAELEILADEIAQCVRYHAALAPDRKVDRLVFVGGEALRTDACRTIARVVRVPAQVADPLAALARAPGFKADPGEPSGPAPQWAVALGLCALPTDL